jgi:uncharacterized membrane protein YfhO
VAAAGDVAGITLPSGSRAGPAFVTRAAGARIALRAPGPGLLVVGEGFDPGFAARVDGVPARVLRVNGDRIGVVLQEGVHRVVLTHQARGLVAGLVAAALAALGLLLARAAREPREV